MSDNKRPLDEPLRDGSDPTADIQDKTLNPHREGAALLMADKPNATPEEREGQKKMWEYAKSLAAQGEGKRKDLGIDKTDIARFKEETEDSDKKKSEDASKDKSSGGGDDGKPPQKDNKPERWSPKKRSIFVTLIIIIFVVVALGLILYAWRLPPFDLATKMTNNAYLRGQITMISPKVNGYVSEVMVQDYDHVYENQPILKIEDTQYAAAVGRARAQLDSSIAALRDNEQAQKQAMAQAEASKASIDQSNAELNRLQIDYKRVSALVVDGSVSKRERDSVKAGLENARASQNQAKAQYRVAQEQVKSAKVQRDSLVAAVDAAKADLQSAEYDLSNTVIRAPREGQLAQIGSRVGQYVGAGSQLTTLVPPVRWVIANYKEKEIENMRIGQAAYVTVDSLSNQKFYGIVTDMAPAAASEFSAIKPDPGIGSFVKVAQRIPVKIQLFTDQPNFDRLSPGMSVEAYVDTDSEPYKQQYDNTTTPAANENRHENTQ